MRTMIQCTKCLEHDRVPILYCGSMVVGAPEPERCFRFIFGIPEDILCDKIQCFSFRPVDGDTDDIESLWMILLKEKCIKEGIEYDMDTIQRLVREALERAALQADD